MFVIAPTCGCEAVCIMVLLYQAIRWLCDRSHHKEEVEEEHYCDNHGHDVRYTLLVPTLCPGS